MGTQLTKNRVHLKACCGQEEHACMQWELSLTILQSLSSCCLQVPWDMFERAHQTRDACTALFHTELQPKTWLQAHAAFCGNAGNALVLIGAGTLLCGSGGRRK